MPIDFPGKTLGEGTGDYYDFNGKRWVWNGRSWTLVANGNIGPTGPTGAISGDYVVSLNGITGPVGLSAGSNIGISSSGKTLTISFSGTLEPGGVTSVNGITGAVGVAAGTAISVSSSGKTLTISNIGVTSFNGQTGAISFINYVSSVNGITGAVGITGQYISVNSTGKTLTLGLSAGLLNLKDVFGERVGGGPVEDNDVLVYDESGTADFKFNTVSSILGNYVQTVNGITGPVGITSGSNISVTSSGKTLTIAFSGTLEPGGVTSVNGITGAVGVAAGTAISVSSSGKTLTISNIGVTSFNGQTGAISFNDYASSVNGITGAVGITAGTAISVSSSGKTLTISNIGVTSFNGQTGAISFVNYVSSANALTGAIILEAGPAISVSTPGSNKISIGNIGVTSFNGQTGAISFVNYVSTLQGMTGAIEILAGTNIGVTWDTSNQKITINSTASGGGAGSNTISVFTPLDNQPPGTTFATLDTRNSIAVLDFADATSDEAAIFVGIVPDGITLSSLLTRIHWAATTATGGTCMWGCQFMSMSSTKTNRDIDNDSFGSTAETATLHAGVTSGDVYITEITNSSTDGITAGNPYRLRVYRAQSNAADTMSGDAELIAVEVRKV